MDRTLIEKHIKLAHTPGVKFECPVCKLVRVQQYSVFNNVVPSVFYKDVQKVKNRELKTKQTKLEDG